MRERKADEKYCSSCGAIISKDAEICPKCGVRQKRTPTGKSEKSRMTAALLALFLGGVGAHKFYLKDNKAIYYLLFFWTFIPAILALIDAIRYLTISDEEFEEKYVK